MAYDLLTRRSSKRDWSLSSIDDGEATSIEISAVAGAILGLVAPGVLEGASGFGFGMGAGAALVACGVGMELQAKLNKKAIEEPIQEIRSENQPTTKPTLTLVP